jgi:hypothetical protein
MKLMLKPPGTKRLKLEYGEPLSSLGFKFNSRCYTEEVRAKYAKKLAKEAGGPAMEARPDFNWRHPGINCRHPGINWRHPGINWRHPGIYWRHPGIN